jgi:hypothetical protein
MKADVTKAGLYFILFAFVALLHVRVNAQIPTVQDCLGAIPVCQNIYVEENSYSGSGNYPNEIYNTPGDCTNDCPGSCLDGEQNSVWYVFTVQQAGLLRLDIDPLNSGDDYDWAVYDISALRCDDIYSQYSVMQKSCNAYGQAPNGNTGISSPNGGTSHCNHCGGSGTSLWNRDLSVLEGRTYVLVVENWSGSNGGYTLDFSGSTAVIFDDVVPELEAVLADEINCGDTEIIVDFSENVECSSVNPGDFAVAGPGGPYTVLDVQGETCLLGGQMEKRYTLIIDRAINNDGTYSVQLKPFNFVSDACDNFAVGNTILFEVDLGAPVINEVNMEIEAATCGVANGSITGLAIAGTPPYSYIWTNTNGDTVGTSLDLTDVSSGDYYLEVGDPNTCETVGGPYFVDQTGAPALDDANIAITPANWGANNGHITGLDISGNEPLTYLWLDENNDSVGNTPELHDVFSGDYFLLITDAYGCDTTGGPYFVQQIGGPLGVQVAANPPEICNGSSSQLSATAFGGVPNYGYLWESDPPGFTSDIPSPLVFPASTTTYYVTINDGFSIVDTSITVVVHPLPEASAGADQTIPYGTSTTISGIILGGSGSYNYFWEPSTMLISPSSQSSATQNLYTSTLFTLQGVDKVTGCVSSFDTVWVMLQGGPLDVDPTSPEDTICLGESATITAFGSGGNYPDYTYKWTYQGFTLKEETGLISTLDVMPNTAENHVYSVEIFDGYNSVSTDYTITVSPTPYFTVEGGPQIVACPLDTVILKPNVVFPGATYYWSNGSTAPEFHLASTGIGFSVRTVNLRITNIEGCMHEDSVTVVFDFAACFGLEEYESYPQIKVYPNPSKGLINVELEEIDGFSELQILNAQGTEIYSFQPGNSLKGLQRIEIDLSAFPKGIYFLRAIHKHFIHHQKVVLQ